MIEITNTFIYVKCSDQQAKSMDAIWVESKNAWRVPNTLGALRELHKFGFDVAEYGKKKAFQRQLLLNRKETPLYIEGLREYQCCDVNFLSSLQHAGVFNEQRTGKTPTVIKLMRNQDKIMVICPASLVLNWKNEVEKWSNYSVIAVSGSKEKRKKQYEAWKQGFLVLSKDTAKADVELLDTSNSVLIVDESHFLRNYKTAQSKAIFKLGKNAKKRLALTGTPATGKGADIFGILHFLFPERFPSYWQFVDRYFKTWQTPWGSRDISSYKRKEELQEILETVSVQRKRSEVMKWLPQKQYQTIEVEMDEKQAKAYQNMLDTFTVEYNGEIVVDASSVLAQLTRLRQICLSPSLLDIKAPSAKESFILEWLSDNDDASVIIFSNFSSYLKRLVDTLHTKKINAETIIGEDSKYHRDKVVKDFQSGKLKVIAANIQAAGVGLTLDKADTVIFLDRSYDPTSNVQAEDRIVATTESSNQNCLIIDVVCKDSIDSRINEILEKKQSVIEVINNYKNIKELVNS